MLFPISYLDSQSFLWPTLLPPCKVCRYVDRRCQFRVVSIEFEFEFEFGLCFFSKYRLSIARIIIFDNRRNRAFDDSPSVSLSGRAHICTYVGIIPRASSRASYNWKLSNRKPVYEWGFSVTILVGTAYIVVYIRRSAKRPIVSYCIVFYTSVYFCRRIALLRIAIAKGAYNFVSLRATYDRRIAACAAFLDITQIEKHIWL